MQRKSHKKTVEPCGSIDDKDLYREVTVELIQTYHDNTKKLIKTEEGARVEGKLFRLAKKGEKADTQIMNAKTFEVLALVAAPKSAYAALEAAEEAEEEAASEEAAAAVEPDEEETPTDETAMEPSTDNTDEPTPEPEPAEAAPAITDEEDDMATKSKKTKKATKKVAKKTATKSVDATSGQSGPSVKIEAVNTKEGKVLGALNHGSGQQKISEIAKGAFKGKVKSQANSWVRNSLRRLVRGGLVKQVSRGTYALTAKGKKFDASA